LLLTGETHQESCQWRCLGESRVSEGTTSTNSSEKQPLERSWSVCTSVGMQLTPMPYQWWQGTVIGHLPQKISRVCTLFI